MMPFLLLAEIYQKKLKDIDKAKSLYEKILLEFKGSIYSSEARKRFRKLRGDNLEGNLPFMIIYNVTVRIDKEIEKQWLDWMKNTHIPDVMNTALFLDCKISRVLSEEVERVILIAVQYSCKNRQDYEKYQNEFAHQITSSSQQKVCWKICCLSYAFRSSSQA